MRLLGDLFQAIEDLDILKFGKVWNISQTQAKQTTFSSWLRFRALSWFTCWCAKAGVTGGTPRTIEGPLLARLNLLVLLVWMMVLSLWYLNYWRYGNRYWWQYHCKVEVWHANSLGNYSFFDNLTLTYAVVFWLMLMVNMNHDACWLWLPARRYNSSPKLGRHGNRPSHVHYFVSVSASWLLNSTLRVMSTYGCLRNSWRFSGNSNWCNWPIQRRGLDHAFKHITFNIVKMPLPLLQLKLNVVALVESVCELKVRFWLTKFTPLPLRISINF